MNKLGTFQTFFLQSCRYLGFKMEHVRENIYSLTISNQYLKHFPSKDYLLSFDPVKEQDVVYTHETSFLTQKISQILLQLRSGIAKATLTYPLEDGRRKILEKYPDAVIKKEEKKTKNMYYIWYKTTLFGVDVEQYLKAFCFDTETKLVVPIYHEILDSFPYLKENKTLKIDDEEFQEALVSTHNLSKQFKNRFVEMKQMEYQDVLEEELIRIDVYYNSLIRENGSGESYFENEDDSYEETYESLKEEKAQLVQKLKEKYLLTEEKIDIKPVSFLFVQQHFYIFDIETSVSSFSFSSNESL